ncbi:MAG UNVERIFIED_CONTAM: hypothetical protein LVR18_07865 [Planctomycetaceae bacterium]
MDAMAAGKQPDDVAVCLDGRAKQVKEAFGNQRLARFIEFSDIHVEIFKLVQCDQQPAVALAELLVDLSRGIG